MVLKLFLLRKDLLQGRTLLGPVGLRDAAAAAEIHRLNGGAGERRAGGREEWLKQYHELVDGRVIRQRENVLDRREFREAGRTWIF